jgi:hypothetical protein
MQEESNMRMVMGKNMLLCLVLFLFLFLFLFLCQYSLVVVYLMVA